MKRDYLKYPVTNLEDLSPREKQKLLNAVLYTPKEETFNVWSLLPFVLLVVFACMAIMLLVMK